LLTRCDGLVIGDKLERRNRLDSRRLTSESTPGELNFALRVEHLLHKIPSAEYRQVTVEAIDELAGLFASTPALLLRGTLVMDVIVGHAVREAWLAAGHDPAAYEREKAAAWGAFYELPPRTTRAAVRAAFAALTGEGDAAA
jgi:phosphorylase kinase alpha/beta subunit